MKHYRKSFTAISSSRIRLLLPLVLISVMGKTSSAQCPVNLDFEQGTFNNWQCYTQNDFAGITTLNLLPTVPLSGRHDMLSNPPGNGNDIYGNFPKNCPNGSGHSIKLGAEVNGGHTADKVSYVFTIPATQNTFSLIYHYAIVLNDAGHPAAQQPRLMIEVKNLTDGTPLPCPMAPIVATGNLPGFQTSLIPANGQPVRFKPWAAASIKLDNLAGKTIELSFTTTGCGLYPNGTHFGYAYIDVNSECSSSFIGATYCPDDAFINVTGPFGYQTYTWWDAGFTTVMGNTQTINFNPPPPPGTILKLVVNPYAGYGCTDTLTATLQDTLTIQSQAGPDRTSCNNAPVQLGLIPKPGYVYSWTPATGLSDPNISNPIASPSVTTQYILTTTHEGGGCASKDTVMVYAAVLDNTIQLLGSAAFCPDGSQSAVLQVAPADSVQWYRNGIAIPGATQPQYNVTQTGTYHATVFSFVGCNSTTSDITVTVYDMPTAGFTVNTGNQCLKNNQFIFTNTSTVASGSLTYEWDLGDGNTATTPNVNHNYATAGTYTVRMIVTTNNGCKDTSFFTANVYDMPVAGFTLNANTQCFKDNQFIFTNTSTIPAGTMQYFWDLGDGNTATTANVTHVYALDGVYNGKLVVTSGNGCVDEMPFTATVYPAPVAGFTVSTPAQQCFKNNQFVFTNTSNIPTGSSIYSWDMGDGNTYTTRDVTHSYTTPGTYKVKMLIRGVNGGCKDSISQDVTVYPTPVANFTVNNANQCQQNNQFIFTNTSTVFSGALLYQWDLGDGATANTATVTHSYAQPGTYDVRLTVTGTNGGCTDNILVKVTVYEYPNADFYIQPVTCTNTAVQIINKTINRNETATLDYLWEFGNGQTSTIKNPIYGYPAPGSYTVKLTVNITGCPTPVTTRELNVQIQAPVPGVTYPDFNARYNFPETLTARQFGASVLWTPGTNLDNRLSYTPVFRGTNPQLYTIQIKTDVGCITTDTLLVKTLKQIKIYVPTVFTPANRDGLNDLLRPLLFGFTKVNYFRVYDRWGKLLFQMQGDRPGWDGKVDGKLIEMQTVVWAIEAVDVDGVVHREEGTTVLMR